jgi:hypothetical protein
MSNTTRAPERTRRRTNRRYGDLVRVTAQISGRAPSTIYRVLAGTVTSAPILDALDKARVQIARARRAAA